MCCPGRKPKPSMMIWDLVPVRRKKTAKDSIIFNKSYIYKTGFLKYNL